MCKYSFYIDMLSREMRKSNMATIDLSPAVTKLGVMIYICISFDTVC